MTYIFNTVTIPTNPNNNTPIIATIILVCILFIFNSDIN